MNDQSNMDNLNYYRDMRESGNALRESHNLRYQHPWPAGVVPPARARAWLAIEAKDKPWPSGCVGGSEALDELLILIRYLLYSSLDPAKSADRTLLDWAFHDFGWNRDADYLVKGRVLDALVSPRPHPQEEVFYGNLSLSELLDNDLVVRNIFANPDFHLLEQETWVIPTGSSEPRPMSISTKDMVQLSRIDYDGTQPLENAVDAHFGAFPGPEGTELHFCSFPRFMRVHYSARGGGGGGPGLLLPRFSDLRDFITLETRRLQPAVVDLIEPAMHRCRYRLCFAANLDGRAYPGDCRTYESDLKPIVPTLTCERGQNWRAKAGTVPGQARWELGEEGGEYLLCYERVDGKYDAYVVPTNEHLEEYGDPVEKHERLIREMLMLSLVQPSA
ncbi:hypothetical protein F4779DRAFT_636993 [Xylariaceae sp. FL0662B]|nr:hypothetical protein F4779DRAFT_636993 [Xylariaceae sp. FL0662B]